MSRRRGRALLAVAAVLAVVAFAGCGRNDFANDPRPPIPAEITVRIDKSSVAVDPKSFGAGLVNFTIANLTTTPGTFVLHGPIDASSGEIPANGTENLKVEMKTGAYEASVNGIAAVPFRFTVGAERASGQNDLLLP